MRVTESPQMPIYGAGGPIQPPSAPAPTPSASPPPTQVRGIRSARPFVLLIVLPPLIIVAALVVLAMWEYPSGHEITNYLSFLVPIPVLVGVAGTIRVERANARARALEPNRASGPPARPYIVLAITALPLSVVMVDTWPLGAIVVLLSMLVAGVTCAVIRSNANRPATANTGAAHGFPHGAPGAIGYTTDGAPIYPVIGYTPDGQPVTADRAVGMRPTSSGTNPLAIAALISAFVVPIVPIVLGHIALSQIRKTGEQGSGLALTGLILGYLGAAAIVAYGVFIAVMLNGI